MKAVLYLNESDMLEVEKKLVMLQEVDIVLKESTSIVDPTLILKLQYQPECNYIYIPVFKRYYYIENIDSINEMTWVFTCHCDVLMSFKEYLYRQNALIDRQEFVYNAMLSDSRLRVNANPYVFQKKFPNGFGKGQSNCIVIAGNKNTYE